MNQSAKNLKHKRKETQTSIALNRGKRTPAILLSLILVLAMAIPGLPLTAQAALPEPLDAWSMASGSELESAATEVNILTFNDFHGQVEPAGSNPGAARFAACMAYLLEKYPNAYPVAGGDNYQGSAVSNYYLGKPVSDMIKAMGVEYSSLGNHEFDWGYEKIQQFAEDGNIDFICSNLFYKGTGDRPSFVKPYAIQEIGGKKIGFVGLIVTETPVLVKAEYAAPFDFRAPGQWLADLVGSLKDDMGCDAVVALSHDGSTGLAGYGLAGVVNGHSHAYQAATVNGTAFVQAGYNGRAIGRLQLVFDDETGECDVTPSYEMVGSLPAHLADADVEAQIGWYLNDSAGMFDAVVGQADIALSGQPVINEWATRLVYDFIERRTGTPSVVVQNSGGWRNMSGLFLAQGEDITYRWLTVLMPFDNEIVLMDLPGNYLIDALNGTRAGGSGSLTTPPVIAGAYQQGGSWYLLDGALIQAGSVYKVSCNDFMLTGGDNYDMFQYGANAQYLGDKLRDALAEEIAFRSGGAVAPLFDAETLTLTPGSDPSSINITWYSGEGAGDGVVKFAGNTVSAASGAATTGKKWHKATVAGLAPDTIYTYSVSNNGSDFSRSYTYKTPKTGTFTFVAVGDPQLTTGLQDATSNLFSSDRTTRMGWAETVAAIQQKLGDKVNFITGVGDQVDLTNVPIDNATSIATSEQEYSNFFEPGFLRSIPIAPAVGNHDRHYGFTYHYNTPNEMPFAPLQSADYGNATNSQYADVESSGNYYYTYNNALFVVLNTSAYPANQAAAAVIVERFDETFKAAIAAKPDYDWLFVQHHKSTASVADHIADRDIQYYVEAGFEKLMDKYGVDFVLAGHDHVYSRSYPLKDGRRGDNQGGSDIINPNGTIYMTFTTASGLKYYELFNAAGNLYVKDNMDYPYLVNGLQGSYEYMNGNLPLSNARYLQAKKPAFTSVTVDGSSVAFETYNIDDLHTPVDAFTVTKSDVEGSGMVMASVRVAEVSDVAAPVEFTVSLREASNVMAVALEFEADGNLLSYAGLETMSGFTAVSTSGGAVEWTNLGNGMYQGKVTLMYKFGTGESLTSLAPADIAKFIYSAKGLGNAAMKLTNIKVSGMDGLNAAYFDSAIEKAVATTSIEEVIVYSLYDLNKDGVTSQLDLTMLMLYCQYNHGDEEWATLVRALDSRGNGVTASACDFNEDGKIDMLDLVELFLNYSIK